MKNQFLILAFQWSHDFKALLLFFLPVLHLFTSALTLLFCLLLHASLPLLIYALCLDQPFFLHVKYVNYITESASHNLFLIPWFSSRVSIS